ncbi:MAG TPA: DUF3857 domain-containing transglutaminase family protein [Steroidobacteraceae bacterium]|nr:DUF3857 domain-containing transglutaminase family protein [Steroidobacteraceae bacterium]
MLAARAAAAGVPDWVRAHLSVPLPAHGDKTSAVVLYSETTVNVERDGKIRQLQRRVFKILRPEGRARGGAAITFLTSQTRIRRMHGWCIPAEGKNYEIGDREAVETALAGILNGELAGDVRTRFLQVPGADPGSIIATEIETESTQPYNQPIEWVVQDTVPVREARYTLEVPAGWTYEATWLHHEPEEPTSLGRGQWQWTVTDEPALLLERRMPPAQQVLGRVDIALIPPGGKFRGFKSWDAVAAWYLGLTLDRREPSAALKQRVAELTASAPTLLAKMQALASAVQSDIRYVAIELGIGGYQPHRAADVLTHGYGDCKDKATLLTTMLAQIGVDSYYVFINSARDAITQDSPANIGFNHVIVAMRLPEEVQDPALQAVLRHPRLGRLLLFDPTDPYTPFGRLSGALQSSYALLVTPDGGELVKTPLMPIEGNGIHRTAHLTLDGNGTLHGEVQELWLGDRASAQRAALSSAAGEADRTRPVQAVLASSLGVFDILKATAEDGQAPGHPLEWRYTLEAPSYAKRAGNLLLVRPHVFGNLSSDLMETPEARAYPVEFGGPERDTDEFDIALPPSYEVDELPPPVDVDDGFASYHSKTQEVAHVLRYTRTFEMRAVTIPAASAAKLKQLYRTIEGDQRAMAVLKSIP